MKNIFCSGR